VLCGKSPFKMCSNALHSTIQGPIKSTRQPLYISWKTCISYVQNMCLLSRCKLGRQLPHGSSYHNPCTVNFGTAKPRKPFCFSNICLPPHAEIISLSNLRFNFLSRILLALIAHFCIPNLTKLTIHI